MLATIRTSERSFSLLKLIKTYLRSTVEQGRLKHLIILSPYKSHFDKIDLIEKALHLLKKKTAGSVHLEGSIFLFFLLCTDYIYVKSLYFTIFSSEIEFYFPFSLKKHPIFYDHSSVPLDS